MSEKLPENRFLFVVGHARSGTTALLEAINTCQDVFLLGESNFYRNDWRTDFAPWYLEMNRQFREKSGEPAGRSQRLEVKASEYRAVLSELLTRHRIVGDKIAFRQRRYDYSVEKFFRYHRQQFLRAHHLYVFRSPDAVIASCINMFESGSVVESAARELSISCAQVMFCGLEMWRVFPKCRVWIHEHITASSFVSLGADIGVDLSGAMPTYHDVSSRRTTDRETTLRAVDEVAFVCDIYRQISGAVETSRDEVTDPRRFDRCRIELRAWLEARTELPLFYPAEA